MLARWNRLKSADEFKSTVRSGSRYGSSSLVTYVLPRSDVAAGTDNRFGFIVGKKVGGAVVRNTVRRRLRAVCASLDPRFLDGHDVVIRALPPAAAQPFTVLYDELSRSLSRGSVIR